MSIEDQRDALALLCFARDFHMEAARQARGVVHQLDAHGNEAGAQQFRQAVIHHAAKADDFHTRIHKAEDRIITAAADLRAMDRLGG